jgi:hypothetical protein
MATDYIELGPTPPAEDCAQVGADTPSRLAQSVPGLLTC